ncbi:DUF2057 family protein [Marinobacter halophilus]|uniref:DUF2057 domain-containing protein n=1 Tax=Marinobacter halophilus TaxID=1323740 RepID=A0A2T1KHV2_9GAMM|nr:DUF2057 family protein [Marinobacter halophilus]PSF09162.1 DUF2057 domain-containing protein [Marinobacter halophilus]GGC82823.1 hypothetical protein GCM10011362_34130 [Marinobacter halophilus]
MTTCHVSSVFKWLAVVVSFTLAGCASSVTRIDTWQGDPVEADNPAVLKAPGEIQMITVNGRKMTNFLISDLALDYGLLPGQNDVVFTYKTIWARTGVVRDGESKVHTIESERQRVSFDAQPGAVYRFQFDRPSSRQQAEAMMKTFSAAIVSDTGEVAGRSELWDGKAMADAPRTPVSSSKVDDETGVADTPLDRLKSVWSEASEEEKRTFLRWAFE